MKDKLTVVYEKCFDRISMGYLVMDVLFLRYEYTAESWALRSPAKPTIESFRIGLSQREFRRLVVNPTLVDLLISNGNLWIVLIFLPCYVIYFVVRGYRRFSRESMQKWIPGRGWIVFNNFARNTEVAKIVKRTFAIQKNSLWCFGRRLTVFRLWFCLRQVV